MTRNHVAGLVGLLLGSGVPSEAALGFTGELHRIGEGMPATSPVEEPAMDLGARLEARQRAVRLPLARWTHREMTDGIVGPGGQFPDGTVFYKVLSETGWSIAAGMEQVPETGEVRFKEGVEFALPAADGAPGAWMPRVEVRKVRSDESGYFVTPNPMFYPRVGMRVFEVEAPELWARDSELGTEAIAPTIRLVRERPDLVPDWWREIERFLIDMRRMALFLQTARPAPRWRVVKLRDHARVRGTGNKSLFDLYASLHLAQERRGIGTLGGFAIKGVTEREVEARCRQQGMHPDQPDDAWVADFNRDVVLKTALIAAGDEAPEWATAEVERRWEVWCAGYGLRDVITTPSRETWLVYRRPTARWYAWSQKAA